MEFPSAAHGRNDSIVHYKFSEALKRMMPASHLDIVPGVHTDDRLIDLNYCIVPSFSAAR